MEKTILTTARLALRPPTAADAAAIESACQDPEIPRWTTVPSPYTRADAEAFIRQVDARWDDGSEAVWAIFAEDRLAGMVGVHDITAHPAGGHAELGFWMEASARRNGYLVEAARAVVDWAFGDLGLVRLRWQAVVGNVPSARAGHALGFRYEGLLRQGLTSPRGRDDGWIAGLLASDDRAPVEWPVLA